MKKKRKSNRVKKIRVRHQNVGDQIVRMVSERKDVTRQMLPELIGHSQNTCDTAMTHLRKAGIKISPSKGPGSPLQIATTQTAEARYIDWRRSRFLGTAKRMIVHEYEIGEQHLELSNKPVELLEILNNAANES